MPAIFIPRTCKVICQICDEVIALAQVDALSYPFNGSMFRTPDPAHDVPAPFHPSLEWADFRCPHGRNHRPIVKDDRIWTDEGMLVLPRDGSFPYLTDEPNVIDRDSIYDRVIMMPDDDAERLVREQMSKSKGDNDVQTDRENEETTDEEPVEKPQKEIADLNNTSWICPACGKGFKTQQALAAHIGKAHPKKKER